MICVFVFPIWAGDGLHKLISKNIERLGNFLEGFGEEYFRTCEGGESNKSLMLEYTSILYSKQNEENLANFAEWEPRHGGFRYRHPWIQYLGGVPIVLIVLMGSLTLLRHLQKSEAKYKSHASR